MIKVSGHKLGTMIKNGAENRQKKASFFNGNSRSLFRMNVTIYEPIY